MYVTNQEIAELLEIDKIDFGPLSFDDGSRRVWWKIGSKEFMGVIPDSDFLKKETWLPAIAGPGFSTIQGQMVMDPDLEKRMAYLAGLVKQSKDLLGAKS